MAAKWRAVEVKEMRRIILTIFILAVAVPAHAGDCTSAAEYIRRLCDSADSGMPIERQLAVADSSFKTEPAQQWAEHLVALTYESRARGVDCNALIARFVDGCTTEK